MPLHQVPPVHASPAPQGVTLDEVQIESQGRVYHVRLGMPCASNGIPAVRRVVRTPSNKETLFVDCDGSTGVDVIADPPQTGAAMPKPKK
jgi:hypothetical protein